MATLEGSYPSVLKLTIKARGGPKKAIMAVQHALLVAICHMFSSGRVHEDLGRTILSAVTRSDGCGTWWRRSGRWVSRSRCPGRLPEPWLDVSVPVRLSGRHGAVANHESTESCRRPSHPQVSWKIKGLAPQKWGRCQDFTVPLGGVDQPRATRKTAGQMTP